MGAALKGIDKRLSSNKITRFTIVVRSAFSHDLHRLVTASQGYRGRKVFDGSLRGVSIFAVGALFHAPSSEWAGHAASGWADDAAVKKNDLVDRRGTFF